MAGIPGWKRRLFFFLLAVFMCAIFGFVQLSAALRPITDSTNSLENERMVFHDDNFLRPYSAWNITGTYKGTWNSVVSANSSSRFTKFRKSAGVAMIEILTVPTKIRGVHYLHGGILFHDMFDNEHDMGVAHLRVEGVYIWPFRQIRLVNSGTDGEWVSEEENPFTNPYHLFQQLGAFSSQAFQESARDKLKTRKNSLTLDMEKNCNLDISAHVSRISHNLNEEIHQRYHLEGLIESPIDDDGVCLFPIQLNASSVNIDVFYNKAINYTLMVTFISVLQVLLLIRQMEHSSTQSGAAKVSIIMIGQQAIIDAYLCLLHLTAGILVESLFNAFATAAFFKFVVFSIFEMRYLLAIWKACRPSNNGEGWDTLRRELSVLYSRFYGILLGGILIMYELHNLLRPILLFMYSFWIPQIISNVIHDTRKPLHPHYILGMTVTRLAIPFYVLGCPNNFMQVNPDQSWCIYLGVFMFIQAVILLLQHYFGSRCFIPRQILPDKYSYYRRFENDSNNGIDCVICMTTIDLSQRSNDCMITPCEHFFHSGCLQRWMDIKMECPTCRRPLPPA